MLTHYNNPQSSAMAISNIHQIIRYICLVGLLWVCRCHDYNLPHQNFSEHYFGTIDQYLGYYSPPTPNTNNIPHHISIDLSNKMEQVYDYEYIISKGKEGQHHVNPWCHTFVSNNDQYEDLYHGKEEREDVEFVAVSGGPVVWLLNSKYELSSLEFNKNSGTQRGRNYTFGGEGLTQNCNISGEGQKISPTLSLYTVISKKQQQHLVLVCQNQGQNKSTLNYVALDNITNQWRLTDSQAVPSFLQEITSQFDNPSTLYLCTDKQVLSLAVPQTNNIQLKKLPIKPPNSVEGEPQYVSIAASGEFLYVLSQKVGLIIYSLDTQNVAYTEGFNGQIALSNLQQIYHDPTQGILQIVAIDQYRIRQFIIQAFHQTPKTQTADHQIHINKIYHSYAINDATNTAASNLGSRHETQRMILGGELSMNMGVLASRHKIIIFQYGLSRTIQNYEILDRSEFLGEMVYSKVLDVRQITDYGSPALTFVILLRNYVQVVKIVPEKIANAVYECHLPVSGSLTDAHYGLKNVTILLKGVCRKDNQISFCKEEQTINFILVEEDEEGHISPQRQRIHYITFTAGEILLLVLSSLLIIVCWRSLLRKKSSMEQQRKNTEQGGKDRGSSNYIFSKRDISEMKQDEK